MAKGMGQAVATGCRAGICPSTATSSPVALVPSVPLVPVLHPLGTHMKPSLCAQHPAHRRRLVPSETRNCSGEAPSCRSPVRPRAAGSGGLVPASGRYKQDNPATRLSSPLLRCLGCTQVPATLMLQARQRRLPAADGRHLTGRISALLQEFFPGVFETYPCDVPGRCSCAHNHGMMHLPQSVLSAPLASLTFFFTSKLEGKMRLQRTGFLSLALIKKEWKERLWLAFILMKVKEKAWVRHGTSLVGSQRPPGGHTGQGDSESGFLTAASFLGLEAEVLEYNIATCLP